MKNYFKKFIFLSAIVITVLSACKTTGNLPQIGSEDNGILKMDESIKTGTLSNGMAFYVKENHEPKNRIVLRLVVKAGSAMEDDDQKGVAHFVEHLAFNGTKNFAKSAIVDYFEKIGMGFGPEVNAYTSFEETVYMLEIPADDPKMLETSLLVLHDWASEISFDPEELEKERGVVTEEWRLSQGLNRRITEKQIPLLLKDSQFQERLPIGDMNIIANVSRQRVIDFYKKWYRPEFMSVIVVGDAKATVLEKAIRNIMGDIPASKEPLEHPEFPVSVQKNQNICILKDPEQKYPVMNIFIRDMNSEPSKTIEDRKNKLALQVGTLIWNQRLGEITNTPDSTWLDAGIGGYGMTNKVHFNYYGIIPKNGVFEESFKAFLDEHDRLLSYGVTAAELERAKILINNQLDLYLKNKDKIESSSIADDIASYVLIGEIPSSVEDDYTISKAIIQELTETDIYHAIEKAYMSRGELMFIVAPSTANDIPSEKELMELWRHYYSQNVSAYSEDKAGNELMARPKEKGKVSGKKAIKEFGGTEYVLDNGIKIITKKTDYEKDVIHMTAASDGGLNLVSDEDYPSSVACVDYSLLSGIGDLSYNQLTKILSTKRISLRTAINDENENFIGTATNKDLESLLQLTNLMFTQPRFTKEGWDVVMNYLAMSAESHGRSPTDALIDKITQIIYKDDIRHAPLDMKFLEKINSQAAEKVYKERFANPADFTFVFVGDFDEKALIDLCCTYLGTMKTSEVKDSKKYISSPFPAGITNETVYKGQDDQGIVYLAFGGTLPKAKDLNDSYVQRQMLDQLKSLIDIRLREAIREEKSGSYGVSVYAGIEGDEKRDFTIQISFGCKPDRQEELKQEVLKELEKLQTEIVKPD